MSDTSDSDTAPSGMVSITTVTPPKLTSFSPEVLVKWTKKWEKFQRDLKMECVRMKRDYATALPSIQSLAEPAELIEGMARFSWFVTMDEVNDEFILKKMKEIMSKPLNNAIPNAENALEKLRWNISEKDVTMRVVNFLIEASSLIEGNGLSEDLKNDKMRKKIFSVILSKVKPATLRASLTERVDRNQNMNPKYDVSDLAKDITELAQENQRSFDTAKKSAPEKRRSESDAALGREPKRARQDEGPKGSNNHLTRRPGKVTSDRIAANKAVAEVMDAVAMVEEAKNRADTATTAVKTQSPSTATQATALAPLKH
ncbi:hypothetical protein H310_11749 [Aphanomyces invadans]|uniref:Uncharacterized protein n=1 Tax=Aphanomyces invadans TaxID=157072 RepID=A0A024TKC3_9STRA|nr:hypothetical protein H310_11749 [Aphanomyces invadans]ETV94424.1 hypothetical protein H310_11749 [Aphanomyces invadans]|eukprot:XP_008876739.1 hypothetical protein H310_11749 [Aphanomyces invadans]